MARIPGRIDTHAHYLPPGYRAALAAAGIDRPDGMPAVPTWDVDSQLALMDSLGIDVSILSVSSPGVHLGDDEAAGGLARLVNDVGAATARAHPGRFGLFASLPLPDIAGSVREIGRAFDDLEADGVVMLTNSRGLYQGDEALEPVYAELDRREARVFIHPTSPACCEQTALGRPRPMLEFLFDSTRAVANLVLNGVIARYPAIEWIIPHGGAALSVVVDRMAGFSAVARAGPDSPRIDVLGAVQRMHYDLAGFPLPHQLPALLGLVGTDKLLYGSDWPFTPAAAVTVLAAALDRTDLVDAAILRANALRLFPRFAD